MSIPQLWSEDLPGVVAWIKKFIAQDKLAGVVDETSVAPLGSIGQAQLWFSAILPDGYHALDGTLIFITEAPDLFNLIGFAYDPTPPAGMFRLPNMPSPTGTWIIRSK